MLPDRIEASANYAFKLRGNQETSSRTTHEPTLVGCGVRGEG